MPALCKTGIDSFLVTATQDSMSFEFHVWVFPAKPTCRENCMGRLENGLALGGVTVGMWGLNSAATHCVFIRVSSTGEPFHGVRIGMGSATNIASCIAVMDLNTCRNRRFQHVFQMLGSYDG